MFVWLLTNKHVCVLINVPSVLVPSVLWHCWLGGRKGIWPVKKLSGGVLAWLSVWSEVQTCIWPSWCHCHSLSLASVKSRLILPFWYRLTRVVPEKGPLNVWCVLINCNFGARRQNTLQRVFAWLVTGSGVCICHASIFGGREQKADGAPVCVVGDKMGCGVEHRSNGKRIVFFTHNSKSVSVLFAYWLVS